MSFTVTFQCGHTFEFSGNEAQSPVCRQCGSPIARVDAPAPVFTGHARGPCSVYRDLPAKAVSFEVSNG